MKLGLHLGYSGAELRVPVVLVQRAEALGYDSVWTAEAYGSDAVTPLAYLAGKTERIKLGTAVMQIAALTPANAAMSAATIDALAGGGRFSPASASRARRSSRAGMASPGAALIGGPGIMSRSCARSSAAKRRFVTRAAK